QPVEVGPGRVDVAVGGGPAGVDADPGLVVEGTLAEGVGGEDDGPQIAGAVGQGARAARTVGRDPDVTGVVAGGARLAVEDAAVEVVAHEEEAAVGVPGLDRVAGGEGAVGALPVEWAGQALRGGVERVAGQQ